MQKCMKKSEMCKKAEKVLKNVPKVKEAKGGVKGSPCTASFCQKEMLWHIFMEHYQP